MDRIGNLKGNNGITETLLINTKNMASSGCEIIRTDRGTLMVTKDLWFRLGILKLIKFVFNMTSSGYELMITSWNCCSPGKSTLKQTSWYRLYGSIINDVLLTKWNMISSDYEITSYEWGTKVCTIKDMSHLLLLMPLTDESCLNILQEMIDMISIINNLDYVDSVYTWGTKVFTSTDKSNWLALLTMIVKSSPTRVHLMFHPHNDRDTSISCSLNRIWYKNTTNPLNSICLALIISLFPQIIPSLFTVFYRLLYG